MVRRPFVVLACALAVTACGIDVQGEGQDVGEGGAPPRGSTDGGGDELGALADDGATESAAGEGASNECACGVAPAAGFTPIAFTPDRSAGCPDALFATNDLVAEPSAGPSACACGTTCTLTSAPSCMNGTFTSKFDDNVGAPCATTSAVSHTGNGGDCTAFTGNLAQNGMALAIAPSAGTCTIAGAPDQAAVTSKSVRACTPRGSTCACDPSLPTAFRTCLIARGDVACPSQAPTKHLAGSSVDLACGACPCKATATCSNSAITFYSDSSCQNQIVTVPDDACVSEGGGTYRSYRWHSTTSLPSCVAGSAPAPALSLVDLSTICCP
jgi:predicted small secreted protein